MKKSILIGALAALMLFAFVACDNGTPVQYGLEAVVATEEPTYILGVAPEVADFSFVGVDSLGNVVSIDESLISDFKRSGAGTVSFMYNKIIPCTAKYEELGTADGVTFEVDATASAVVKDYYKATDYDNDKYTNDLISLDGVIVTAAYNGTETVLDNSILSASIATTDWQNGNAAATVKISYGDTELTGATYTVNVADNRVAKIEMVVDPEYVVYVYSDTTGNKARTLDDAAIYINKIMANGEELKNDNASSSDIIWATTVDGLKTSKATKPSTVSTLPNTAGNAFTLYAQYVGDSGVVGFDRTPIYETFTLAADRVTDIKVEPGTLEIGTDYSEETTTPTGWKVTRIHADKQVSDTIELTLNAETNGFSINPESFSAETYREGDWVNVSVTAEGITKTVPVKLVDAE